MQVRGLQKKRSRRLSLNGWIVIGLVFLVYWWAVSRLQSSHEEPDANKLQQPRIENHPFHSPDSVILFDVTRVWEQYATFNPKRWKTETDSHYRTAQFHVQRPSASERKFASAAVDERIDHLKHKMMDRDLAILFENCLPNTLDTTVLSYSADNTPTEDLDSFIITGDIEAMWLRDSTNQVWPYLRFVKDDLPLKNLIRGLINRQIKSVILDPYANAYHKDPNQQWGGHNDKTERKAGVFERKYELDSLVSVLRLSVGYYEASHDKSVFDNRWAKGVGLILDTILANQKDDSGYTFRRDNDQPTETLLHGVGQPTRFCGLSRSPFRPSDDASVFPYLVPANAMADVAIRKMIGLGLLDGYSELENKATRVLRGLEMGLNAFGIVHHPYYGRVFAFEVDGYGSHYLADDANLPSLLSLPYIGYVSVNNTIYQNTRKMILSYDNPYFFSGEVAEGIGSPHGEGKDFIWPMSIIMRALTSQNDKEIEECLMMLKRSSAKTGFMHESFHKDDASRFTRKWFAWVNTLYGELILHLAEHKPQTIF